VEVEQVLGAADERRIGWVSDRFRIWIDDAVVDEVEAGVVSQVPIVENEPDTTLV
jgi:hypothetical protein